MFQSVLQFGVRSWTSPAESAAVSITKCSRSTSSDEESMNRWALICFSLYYNLFCFLIIVYCLLVGMLVEFESN